MCFHQYVPGRSGSTSSLPKEGEIEANGPVSTDRAMKSMQVREFLRAIVSRSTTEGRTPGFPVFPDGWHLLFLKCNKCYWLIIPFLIHQFQFLPLNFSVKIRRHITSWTELSIAAQKHMFFFSHNCLPQCSLVGNCLSTLFCLCQIASSQPYQTHHIFINKRRKKTQVLFRRWTQIPEIVRPKAASQNFQHLHKLLPSICPSFK